MDLEDFFVTDNNRPWSPLRQSFKKDLLESFQDGKGVKRRWGTSASRGRDVAAPTMTSMLREKYTDDHLFKGRYKRLVENYDVLQDNCKEQEVRMLSKEHQCASLRAQVNELKNNLAACNTAKFAEISDLQQKFDSAEYQLTSEINNLKHEYTTEINLLMQQINFAEAQHAAQTSSLMQQHAEQVDSLKQQHTEQMNELKRQINSIQSQHAAERDDLEKLHTSQVHLTQFRTVEAHELKQTLEQLQSQLLHAHSTIQAAHQEGQQMRQLARDIEGLIKSELGDITRVMGTVARDISRNSKAEMAASSKSEQLYRASIAVIETICKHAIWRRFIEAQYQVMMAWKSAAATKRLHRQDLEMIIDKNLKSISDSAFRKTFLLFCITTRKLIRNRAVSVRRQLRLVSHVVRKVFEAWSELRSELLHVRSKLANKVCVLKKNTLAWAMRTWHQGARQQVCSQKLLRMKMRHLSQSNRIWAISKWREALGNRRLLRRALLRIKEIAMCHAWEAWHQGARIQAYSQKLLRARYRRLSRSSCMWAISEWRDAIRTRHVLQKVQLRPKASLIRQAWEAWHIHFVNRVICKKLQAMKCRHLFQSSCMWAISEWRDAIRTRHVLQKVMLRMKAIRMCNQFEAWHQGAREAIRTRHILRRVMLRMTTLRLQQAWQVWQQYVIVQEHTEEEAEHAAQLRDLKLQHMTQVDELMQQMHAAQSQHAAEISSLKQQHAAQVQTLKQNWWQKCWQHLITRSRRQDLRRCLDIWSKTTAINCRAAQVADVATNSFSCIVRIRQVGSVFSQWRQQTEHCRRDRQEAEAASFRERANSHLFRQRAAVAALCARQKATDNLRNMLRRFISAVEVRAVQSMWVLASANLVRARHVRSVARGLLTEWREVCQGGLEAERRSMEAARRSIQAQHRSIALSRMRTWHSMRSVFQVLRMSAMLSKSQRARCQVLALCTRRMRSKWVVRCVRGSLWRWSWLTSRRTLLGVVLRRAVCSKTGKAVRGVLWRWRCLTCRNTRHRLALHRAVSSKTFKALRHWARTASAKRRKQVERSHWQQFRASAAAPIFKMLGDSSEAHLLLLSRACHEWYRYAMASVFQRNMKQLTADWQRDRELYAQDSDRAMSLWESSLQEKERERKEEREMWGKERDEMERQAERFKAEHEEQLLELAKQMHQLKEQMHQLKSTVVERELRIRDLEIERDGAALDKRAQATQLAKLNTHLLALQHSLDHTRQCKQSYQHASKSNLKRMVLRFVFECWSSLTQIVKERDIEWQNYVKLLRQRRMTGMMKRWCILAVRRRASHRLMMFWRRGQRQQRIFYVLVQVARRVFSIWQIYAQRKFAKRTISLAQDEMQERLQHVYAYERIQNCFLQWKSLIAVRRALAGFMKEKERKLQLLHFKAGSKLLHLKAGSDKVVVPWDSPLLRPSSTHTLSVSLQDARLRALSSPISTHSHLHKSPHHKRDEHQASPTTPSGTLLSIASTLISHPDTSAILCRRAARAASASLSHPTRSPLTSHSATSSSPPASSPPPRPASSDGSRVTVTFDSPSASSSPPRPASAGASRSTYATPVDQPRQLRGIDKKIAALEAELNYTTGDRDASCHGTPASDRRTRIANFFT